MQGSLFDVLIIGSGAAGLRAAIDVRKAGARVAVVSKASPGKRTATGFSGGVFAATPPGRTADSHRRHTLQAGRGLNQTQLVEILANEGPARLQELIDWGIDGVVRRGYLYARGRAPVWGEAIVRCLLQKNQQLGTLFVSGVRVVGLRMKDENWLAEAVDTATGKRRHFGARALIMATGGASALYRRHDNPRGMLGDGYVLALDAGAGLQDMEFVQFYPLGLAEPGLPPFIIPPGLADRGRLLNGAGEDIHDKYNIQERPAAELARDALSRALFIEMERLGQDVWLDARSVPADGWRADPFSASTEKLLGERYGAKHRPLRVAPMAHHVMGGVSITAHCETSVPGLFAAGEVTGGLHGANRMGGNALTETMVFGKRAGEAAAAWSSDRPAVRFSPPPAGRREPGKAGREKNVDADDLMRRLQDIMWREGGIMRSPGGLQRALSAVSEWEEAVEHSPCRGESRSVQRQIDLRIALGVAELILQAALRRRESRGAHFREDFPAQSDSDWLGHLHVERISPNRNAWRFVLSPPQGCDGKGR